MSIKDEILQYRARENLSQLAFAERVGLSKGTIAGIEAGTQTPTPLTVTKIRLLINQEEENNDTVRDQRGD